MYKDYKNIRKAKRGDEHAIMDLIKELAEYENASEEVINTPEQLAIDLFDDKICDCFVYELDGKVIAMALYYVSYSTWRGRSFYLEDLYIQLEHRRKGIGRTLFNRLIDEAHRMKARRMDWQVLDWNNPAIKFYKKINAELSQEWINGRLYFD